MKKRNFNITKRSLIESDVMNTLSGGISLPSVELARKEDHDRLDVRVPGVSPDALKVDIEGQRLIISRSIEVKGGNEDGTSFHAQNVIHAMPLPQHVDPERIRAKYDKKGLHVLLPHSRYAQGYHKNVEIER